MNLQDLKKQIPYKWRVQSVSKYKPKASCVAYIDARDAMDLLDKVCGPENWQDDYKVVDGKLFGGVGIKIGEQWVWKWDTGTESATEQDKGKVSDAFKRAAVKWGVGRFLYSMKIKYVDTNEKKTSTNRPFPVFPGTKDRIWDLTEFFSTSGMKAPPPLPDVEVKSEEIPF